MTEGATEIPVPPHTQRVEYQQTGYSTARIAVAGHDLTGIVSRFTLDHDPNDRSNPAPKVFLELKQSCELPEIISDASVYVRETVHEDELTATLRFLEPIDPAEFEKACLAALELGGPTTFGEAALFVLRGYAGGAEQ